MPVRAILGGRVFRGWYITAFGAVALMLAGPYVFGIFLRPMTEELEWSRGDFALANTVSVFMAGVVGFFVGPIVDGRRGRWMIAAGAVIAGLSLAALAFVDEMWQFWVLRGVIFVIGSAGVSPLVVNSTISKWFVRRRGTAISIASMGLSSGAIVVAPVIAWVVEVWGWRTGWVVQGALIILVLAVPAVLIIRRQPEDLGLNPDGDTDAELAAQAAQPTRPNRRIAANEVSWTRAEAMRTRQLWTLIIVFGLSGISSNAVFLHLIPFLQDVGFSAAMAVGIVGFQNTIALISKPGWGMLMDRYDPRHMIALGWASKLLPLCLWPLVGSDYGLWAMLPLNVLYGIGAGAQQSGQEVIWAYCFGRRHIGAVRSVALPVTTILFAGGVWFAGAAWDATGSYALPFILFAVFCAIAMAGIMVIRPPVRPPAPVDRAPAATSS
ncbi:MAG: MFS transporter [Dehalococcoidia bacterium]